MAGRIVNGDNTTAAGAKVVLMRGSTVLGTTLSDATGNFAFTFKVTQDLQELQGEVGPFGLVAARISSSAAMTIKVN